MARKRKLEAEKAKAAGAKKTGVKTSAAGKTAAAKKAATAKRTKAKSAVKKQPSLLEGIMDEVRKSGDLQGGNLLEQLLDQLKGDQN